MTLTELNKYVGKRGLLRTERGKLAVQVTITDARDCYYGRVDLLVTPIAGSGSAWVCADSVTRDKAGGEK